MNLKTKAQKGLSDLLTVNSPMLTLYGLFHKSTMDYHCINNFPVFKRDWSRALIPG